MCEFCLTDNAVEKLPFLQSGPPKDLGIIHSDECCPDDVYGLSWGWGIDRGYSLVGEFGFFRNASWLDRKGIYWQSSLTTDEGVREVLDFVPPQDIITKVIESPKFNTKYAQPVSTIKWSGVVLAAQNPLDCNLAYESPFNMNNLRGHDEYMGWYVAQCKKYGRSLLVKIHPFVAEMKPWAEVFTKIADRYGASAAICNQDCYTYAEKVITYTSTVALDCWMRGIPCEQHSRGTFMRFNDETGKQLAHFLMWKYCLPTNMNAAGWMEVLKQFKTSQALYPLSEAYSWARWFLNTNQDAQDVFDVPADKLTNSDRVTYGQPRYSA